MKTLLSFIITFLFLYYNFSFSQVIPNDPLFGNQWYLNMPGNDNTRADIRIIDAWSKTMGNTSQKIADIESSDGGIPSHDDLSRITIQGLGIPGEHSTNIAGILIADHNTIGIAGLNKYAQLYSYVYDDKEQWADKIRDARLDGNKIINISQGVYESMPDVAIRLMEAHNSNIVNIISAGNSNSSITNPGSFAGVITVGASTKDNTSATWSNYGSKLNFLAPGGSTLLDPTNNKNIYTTSSNGSYIYASGTSMAAPIVSGATSLLLAYKPDLTNEDVKNILRYSCDKLAEMGSNDFTTKCGYGRINLKKAMQLLEAPYTIYHGTATLTKIPDVERRSFFENPVFGSGVYFVDMYKLSVDRDDLDYLEPPKAWLPVGYSGAEPNYCKEFLSVSTTQTSVHAFTFFYYVKTSIDFEPIYMWFPYDPTQSQHYTILGKPAFVNVTLTTAQFPEGAGSGGTYEVNGVNVGPTFNGTIHVGQIISAIPPSGSYFYKWSDGNISNQRTIIGNVNIYAIYKTTQLSNDQNAYKYNNQRKFIRTPNGTLHSTYQSMNAIWYEISTNNGQTWQLKDYSMQPNPTWNVSEPSISYYVNSSNQTIVVIAWRLQRGLPEDWIKMQDFVYDPVYGLIDSDEQDVCVDNPEMLSVERTSPVVTCAPNGKTLIIWENKINGVQSSFKYSYGERLSNGVWVWYQSNQWLGCTSNGALSPAVYSSNIGSFLKFHLAWVQNNKIYYCCIYPNDENELEYDPQNIEVSERSGYSTNSRPTITGTDYVSGSYRVEWLRFAWIGYRDAYIDDPCAVSAGESRVLYRYKTSSSWSSISALGSNANSVSINKGTTVMNNWEPMACAWSEGNNCNYPNKYVKSHESGFIIRALNTTGDHLQLNNSTDFNNMYANSFHRNSSPFFFQVSNNLAGQIQKIEAIEIFKGREGVVTKDNAAFYYAIGDITVDGEVQDFNDFPDTISVNDLQAMNEYLLTKPFNVTNSSTLTYGVQYGITDSAAAVAALSDGSAINFRVELVDNQTTEILGIFDEVTYTSSNIFQYENIGYQIDLSGIGSRTVILKLVTGTEADCDYSITNRYSDTESLNKNGYKQIAFEGSSLVTEYALEQNYPNPFNPTTVIKYQIPNAGIVVLKVYDILGSEVTTLVDEEKVEGRYEVNFDASYLASGVYIYRLNVNDYVNVKKMILIK